MARSAVRRLSRRGLPFALSSRASQARLALRAAEAGRAALRRAAARRPRPRRPAARRPRPRRAAARRPCPRRPAARRPRLRRPAARRPRLRRPAARRPRASSTSSSTSASTSSSSSSSSSSGTTYPAPPPARHDDDLAPSPQLRLSIRIRRTAATCCGWRRRSSRGNARTPTWALPFELTLGPHRRRRPGDELQDLLAASMERLHRPLRAARRIRRAVPVGGTSPTAGYARDSSLGLQDISIAWNNDLVVGVTGNAAECFQGGPAVVRYDQQLTPGGQGISGSFAQLPRNLRTKSATATGGSWSQTLTPAGQPTSLPSGVPDGAGGTYRSASLPATLDLGCGPMVPTLVVERLRRAPGPDGELHLQPRSSPSSPPSPSSPTQTARSSASPRRPASTSAAARSRPRRAAAPSLRPASTPGEPASSERRSRRPRLAVVLDPSGSAVVSGLVGPTPVTISARGGGPLAPLGPEDVILGELDVLGPLPVGQALRRPASPSRAPGCPCRRPATCTCGRAGPARSISAAGSSRPRPARPVVGTGYASSGAVRWSQAFPPAPRREWRRRLRRALVLASRCSSAAPGPFPGGQCAGIEGVAIVRFAP